MSKVANLVLRMIVLLFGLVSCSKDFVSEQELKEYIHDEDNGLKKSIAVDALEMGLTFRPSDLLIAQELQGEGYDAATVERLRVKYGSHYYFILSLSRNGKEALAAGSMPPAMFSDLLQTISFRMAEFVNVTTPKQDTIPLADYVYNRTFGLAGSTDLLILFEKEKTIKEDWLQVNLKEFGMGTGSQSLRFRIKDLEILPRINFTTSLQQKSL